MRLLAIVLGSLLLAALPAVANADVFLAGSVACASTTACVAVGSNVDSTGRTVSPYTARVAAFNPAVAQDLAAVPFGDGIAAGPVACPTASVCVVGGAQPRGSRAATAVVFNPDSPGQSKPITLAGDKTRVASIACPSSSQCTAVIFSETAQGTTAVTFNPTTGTSSPPLALQGPAPRTTGAMTAIACPSVSQCTAVGAGEETFDPTSGAVLGGGPHDVSSRPGQFPGDGAQLPYLSAVDCPSTAQCTTIGVYGGMSSSGGQDEVEVTFNPTSGEPSSSGTQSLRKGDDAASRGLACPTLSSCTVFPSGVGAFELTFDPAGPIDGAATEKIGKGNPIGVACPSVSRCVSPLQGYDDHDVPLPPVVVTFAPKSGDVTATTLVEPSSAIVAAKLKKAASKCNKIKNRKKRAACVKKAKKLFG